MDGIEAAGRKPSGPLENASSHDTTNDTGHVHSWSPRSRKYRKPVRSSNQTGLLTSRYSGPMAHLSRQRGWLSFSAPAVAGTFRSSGPVIRDFAVVAAVFDGTFFAETEGTAGNACSARTAGATTGSL